jgi:hypothetical protein
MLIVIAWGDGMVSAVRCGAASLWHSAPWSSRWLGRAGDEWREIRTLHRGVSDR